MPELPFANTVGHFARSQLITCPPETQVAVAAALMRNEGCSSVLVVMDGVEVGIWTERDAMQMDFDAPSTFDTPISALMSTPVHTIAADALVDLAVLRFQEADIRHLLVINGEGQTVGIVTQTDLVLHQGVERYWNRHVVSEIVATPPLQLPSTLTAAAAARQMAVAGRDAALVRQGDGSLGILTERDLLGLIAQRRAKATLGEIASFPLRRVAASQSLLEARRILVDGKIRHLGVTNEQGEVVGLLSLHDILAMLERSYAADLLATLGEREAALLHSRKELLLAHQIIDSSESGLMVVATGGTVVNVNPAFTRLTGVTAEEAIGAAAELLLGCECPEQANLGQALAQAFENGHWRGDLCCHCKGGHPRTLAVSMHLLKRETRSNRLCAVMFYDATEHRNAQEELRRSESRYRTLVENLPLGITVMDHDHRILYTNHAFNALFNKPAGWFIGRLCYAEYEKRAAPCPHCPGVVALASGEPSDVETCGVRDDGTQLLVHNRAIPHFDDSGAIVGFIEIVEDITQRKQAQEQLRLAASVFTHAREGILLTDLDGRIVDANDAFCRTSGYPREEMLGKTPAMFRSGRHGPKFYAAIWQSLGEHGYWSGELWNRRKDGSQYAQSLTISAVHDADGQPRHYVSLCSDITQQKLHQQELERVAHYDALTGLPNRSLLTDRMGQALAHSRRSHETLAVCLMDLDGFKPINDTYGHKAGDLVLQEIAARLLANIREEDTAARLGGDEFVLLLGGFTDHDHYEAVLRRLLAAIARPITVEEQTVMVSASLGVTLFPGDAVDADQLLRHADQAMYKAKLEGKNRIHLFNPSLESRMRANQALLSNIDQAIAQGQFELHYQPKVDCRAGRVVGVEALLRWNHPILGLRVPAEFLPLIEQEDVIIHLGEWVIATALHQGAQWLAEGRSLPISVNIAARQLMHGNLAQYLHNQLAQHPQGLALQLTLELVETAVLEDIQMVRGLMMELQPHGVSFSLDDFGTGYSTLMHLKQLPVNELKIDLAFIRDMFDDPSNLAIVEGIIGLGRAFGHRVVAEGVESIEQILMLLELGCDVMQGFSISRPLPAAELSAWFDIFDADPRWRMAGQGYPLRTDFELLLLEVGHRHWYAQLTDHQVANDTPLETAYDHCPLARWHANGQRRPPEALAAFNDLAPLHRRLHTLATQFLASPTTRADLTAARLALEETNEVFTAQLQAVRSTLSDTPPSPHRRVPKNE